MDMVLKDRAGDVVELERTDDGAYISVEQDGKLVTAGPFSEAALHTFFHLI